jgi:hypothetical protein
VAEKRDEKGAERFLPSFEDVPPQQPIPKSAGRLKDGASKYAGVTFDKVRNKWMAHISIDGKNRVIGSYENEEGAAVDYARAVFIKRKDQVEQRNRNDAAFDRNSFNEFVSKWLPR